MEKTIGLRNKKTNVFFIFRFKTHTVKRMLLKRYRIFEDCSQTIQFNREIKNITENKIKR